MEISSRSLSNWNKTNDSLNQITITDRIQKFLDRKFRISLYKEFSQKERMEIYFQANSIFLWEYARSLGTYLTVVENVKKKRTDKEVINLIGSITPQQIQGFILKLNEGLEKEIPKLEKRFGKL